MKLRMASIEHLVDLQDIGELKGITVSGGAVTIGAMTTQHELIASEALAKAAPIVREAALQIADPQVRYMGTVGGNVANGDPGNDMPGLMQCLDATFTLVGPDGSRDGEGARLLPVGLCHGARRQRDPDARSASRVPSGGYAYEKQKRKIGDYATAACAALVTKSGGRVTAASVAMTNLSDTPVFSAAAGAALVGTAGDAAAVKAAVAAALDDINPSGDNRGPVGIQAACRRHRHRPRHHARPVARLRRITPCPRRCRSR